LTSSVGPPYKEVWLTAYTLFISQKSAPFRLWYHALLLASKPYNYFPKNTFPLNSAGFKSDNQWYDLNNMISIEMKNETP
jgi:hypothetical protein